MYIIPFFCMMRGLNGDLGALFVLWLSGYGFSPKVFHFSVLEEKRVGEFFMGGSWCDESGISFEFLYYK